MHPEKIENADGRKRLENLRNELIVYECYYTYQIILIRKEK